MIKGQESIFDIIDNLENLPHSILLKGEQGSGRNELCKYIAKKFNLQLYDITEEISREFVETLFDIQTMSLLVADLNKVTIKEQNILLKLFEEPGDNIFIVLKCINDSVVLDTIKSRSWSLNMNRYSHELLSECIKSDDGELILKVCSTPGQIEVANHTDMKALDLLCDNIISKMSVAPFFNVMSIVKKINFKDEYDKFDLLLFVKMLRLKCLEYGQVEVYKELIEFNKYVWSMNNKSQYFEHFLIRVWEIYHGRC